MYDNLTAKQQAFLEAYSKCGTISQAAEAAGITRKSHRDWMQRVAYAAAFKEAFEAACEALEQEARRRAVDGWKEPVYFKGEVVGSTPRYSDGLLIFLMKGAMPDKYAERVKNENTSSVEITNEMLEKIVAGSLVQQPAAPIAPPPAQIAPGRSRGRRFCILRCRLRHDR